MKINKFDIMCELAVDENGMLTGWFETPATPHVRYDVEIDLGPLIEEAEDKRLDAVMDAEAANCPHEELDQQGKCEQCGEKIGGQIDAEKVLLPGGGVADVTLPKPGEVGGAPITTEQASPATQEQTTGEPNQPDTVASDEKPTG